MDQKCFNIQLNRLALRVFGNGFIMVFDFYSLAHKHFSHAACNRQDTQTHITTPAAGVLVIRVWVCVPSLSLLIVEISVFIDSARARTLVA